MARTRLCPLSIIVLVLAGCAEELPGRGFLSRAIPTVEADAAFDQAAAIMRREFGRVVVDRERLTVTAPPAEYAAQRDSGTARDLIGAPSTLRRSATMRVARRGDQTVASLRVEIERRDARRESVQQPPSRLSDSPSYTPIDRDAATTERQNTAWTYVRRDQPLERALLDELREWAARLLPEEELNQPSAAPETAPPAEPAAKTVPPTDVPEPRP